MSRDEATLLDLLKDIRRHLERIALALEAYNDAAISRAGRDDTAGHIEIFATTHEA